MLFIYEAWHKVSEETIKNCWRHSGILNQLETTETIKIHLFTLMISKIHVKS